MSAGEEERNPQRATRDVSKEEAPQTHATHR